MLQSSKFKRLLKHAIVTDIRDMPWLTICKKIAKLKDECQGDLAAVSIHVMYKIIFQCIL